METFFLILLIVVFHIICAGLAGTVAAHKGQNSTSWTLAGLFFGVLGLIGSAGLPYKKNYISKQGADIAKPLFIKKCPDCAELINAEAIVCKYCSRKFNQEKIINNLFEFFDLYKNDREEIIKILKGMQNPIIATYIINYLKNKHHITKEVRYDDIEIFEKLIFILIKYDSPEVINEISNILKNTNSEFIAEVLVKTLGKLKNINTLPVLIDSLKRFSFSSDIVNSIAEFENDAIPHIEELSKEFSKKEKQQIERIIKKIKKKN